MSPRRGEQLMVPPAEFRSYYGRPIIKEPVWTWEIPVYFFTGGLAGASAGLAWGAGLRGNDRLARRAWARSRSSSRGPNWMDSVGQAFAQAGVRPSPIRS